MVVTVRIKANIGLYYKDELIVLDDVNDMVLLRALFNGGLVLITAIYPYLCQYKRDRADQCLRVIESKRPQPIPCKNCGSFFTPSLRHSGFAKTRQIYCGANCRNKFNNNKAREKAREMGIKQ